MLYLVNTMPSWMGDKNPIMVFPVFMAAMLVCLPGDKIARLTIGGILYPLTVSINMMLDSLHLDDRALVPLLLLKMLVWCGLAAVITRIAPKDGLQLSRKLWVLLGGLTLMPLMSTLSFSIWDNQASVDTLYQFYRLTLNRLGFTMLPFAAISALMLLVAAVVLSRHEALERENQLAALREVYYAGLKQEQTQLRTLRHDLHNHVAALQSLAEQGKQPEVMGYLNQLAQSPALGGGTVYTANEIANVVLASKAAQMAAAGLVADFSVQLPPKLDIADPELCALLGNALDNAIEGAAGAENRTITLHARVEKGVFMLQVRNGIGRAIHPDLSTTKADSTQHGYGLAGMREIAQRHGGSLEAAGADGQFELLICFPCGQSGVN